MDALRNVFPRSLALLLLDRSKEDHMNGIFSIIGVVVVVLFVLGYFGLR